jgi:hypothetical protein
VRLDLPLGTGLHSGACELRSTFSAAWLWSRSSSSGSDGAIGSKSGRSSSQSGWASTAPCFSTARRGRTRSHLPQRCSFSSVPWRPSGLACFGGGQSNCSSARASCGSERPGRRSQVDGAAFLPRASRSSALPLPLERTWQPLRPPSRSCWPSLSQRRCLWWGSGHERPASPSPPRAGSAGALAVGNGGRRAAAEGPPRRGGRPPCRRVVRKPPVRWMRRSPRYWKL